MERRRSPGVPLFYAGLIGLEVGHDFVMVFAASSTLAATLGQAGSFTLMRLVPQYYPFSRWCRLCLPQASAPAFSWSPASLQTTTMTIEVSQDE